MAKPPSLSLKSEDFPKLLADYPEFEALIRNLNRFGTQVTSSLNKGSTFADNIASQESVLTFDTDAGNLLTVPGGQKSVAIALKLPQGIKAKHVTITQAVSINTNTRAETPAVLSGPAWTTSGTSLLVSAVGGTAASTRYRANLLIVGG
jgi:hypothetical protein